MSTHLFAFNPKLWNWPTLAGDIRTLRRRGHFDTEWSCGRFRNIEPGSRAFMVRLGVPPKGLIGSGVVMTAPAERDHWVESKRARGTLSRSVMLRFDELFLMPLITFDELEVPPWRRFRWGIRASGTRLPSTLADALEPWWAERVEHANAARPARAPSTRLRRS
jgi:5-methylcytosine-specific restriction protein A